MGSCSFFGILKRTLVSSHLGHAQTTSPKTSWFRNFQMFETLNKITSYSNFGQRSGVCRTRIIMHRFGDCIDYQSVLNGHGGHQRYNKRYPKEPTYSLIFGVSVIIHLSLLQEYRRLYLFSCTSNAISSTSRTSRPSTRKRVVQDDRYQERQDTCKIPRATSIRKKHSSTSHKPRFLSKRNDSQTLPILSKHTSITMKFSFAALVFALAVTASDAYTLRVSLSASIVYLSNEHYDTLYVTDV